MLSVSRQWFAQTRNPETGAFHVRVCRQNCPSSRLPFLRIQRVLRQNCHLYANLEGDKEKTRARVRESRSEERWRRGEGDGESERKEKGGRIFTYESTHVVTRWGEVALLLAKGRAFLRRLTRCARPGQTEGRRLLLSREKRATCGDNSIVHFIRSAALRYKYAYPLSWNSAGDKAREGRRVQDGAEGSGAAAAAGENRGILYRSREDYERWKSILTPRIMGRPRGAPN